MKRHPSSCVLLLCVLVACAAPPGPSPTAGSAGPPAQGVAWALALHGGAGTIPRDLPEEQVGQYRESLERALRLGASMLDEGASAVDTVEQVIRLLEDDPLFNAGKGAVYNHEGVHELDASIMNGADLACGAVAGVTTVRNPISLARLVMERSGHVLLAGAGAEAFADEMGVPRVDQQYFHTERRREQLERALERETAAAEHGTVGCVVLDREGNLAAGTSTGGITAKRYGRVGDSPVIGAGTYADNRTCAVSATGKGEEFIRHGVAFSVSALMAHRGLGLQEAAERVIHDELQPGDGGIIAVGHDGSIAMVFNTAGMYRGAADASGRFEIAIWD